LSEKGLRERGSKIGREGGREEEEKRNKIGREGEGLREGRREGDRLRNRGR
jgi:hypothetical protein